MVNLDDNNKKNWKEFREENSHTTIKKENRKRYILVDEQLWRDFSVCVIKKEKRSNKNSEVIVGLIKKFIEENR